jgi:hypothetical protein
MARGCPPASTSNLTRAVAARRLDQLAACSLTSEPPTLALNVAGYAWSSALDLVGHGDGLARIRDALSRGGDGPAATTLLGAAWRTLFLASARQHLAGSTRARVDAELGERLPALQARVSATSVARIRRLAHAARLAFVLARVAAAAGCQPLADDAVALVEQLADRQRPEGWFPEMAESDEAAGPARTADLFQVLLAAAAVGAVPVSDSSRNYLFATRFDAESALFRRDDDPHSGFETSPWIPLALADGERSFPWADEFFDPPAPDPPAFLLTHVDADPTGLRYSIELDGRTFERTVDAAALNTLVARILDSSAGGTKRLWPRGHAHRALAYFSLAERCAERRLRARLNRESAASLERILDQQQENGGWFYARDDAPSVVFTPGRRRSSTFRNLQYTIDAAVPGAALARAHARTGLPQYRDAALRALGFFEDEIGRVAHGEREVWRLFPEDDKTARMGTAVNYELWNAFFFAELASIVEDPVLEQRLIGYVADAVAYAGSHLGASGDIAYGDYVGENRTAYASWDAYLLAEIGAATEDSEARELAERIVTRLADVMLPSGLLPNVVEYEERIGPFRRRLVHRHGIGPYPVRPHYQLYYVVAAALAGQCNEAALRALGFVLLHLYDETFVASASGYSGDGTLVAQPTVPIPTPEWFVLAISLLPEISRFDYAPSRTPVRRSSERMLDAMRAIVGERRREPEKLGEGLDVYEREIPHHYADAYSYFGRGFAALFRAGCGSEWLEAAKECGAWLLRNRSGDHDSSLARHHSWGLPWPYHAFQAAVPVPAHQPYTVTTTSAAHLLLDLHELTGDQEYGDAASDAAAWLVEECGYAAREDGVGFYFGSHPLLQEKERSSVVYNAHSEAIGFLARLAAHRDDDGIRVLVRQGLSFLVASQDDDGLWPYAERSRRKEHHQAMVQEGLLYVLAQSPAEDRAVREALARSCKGTWQRLHDPNGKGYVGDDRQQAMWAQHAALQAATFWRSGDVLGRPNLKDYARRMAQYLFHAYRRVDGTFVLSPEVPLVFVRPSAIVFFALASIFERDSEWTQ